ncbi:hypothetical protein L7F22_043929 [Adiantum nelumboides]|nr:hypothetical protein [Adiantum nelumboides]
MTTNGHIPILPSGQFVALPDKMVAPKAVVDDTAIYKFWKVEDFFNGFVNVVDNSAPDTPIFDGLSSAKSSTQGGVKDVRVSPSDSLTLQVILPDNGLLIIEVIRYDTVRIRWGPSKTQQDEYSDHLSRSIVMNTLSDLRNQIEKDELYKLSAVPIDQRSGSDGNGQRFEWSVRRSDQEHMKVIVRTDVFSIEIWRNVEEVLQPTENKQPLTKWALVWSTTAGNATGNLPLLSRLDAEGNYASCLSMVKRGKMIGFGEQGGFSFLKDNNQLNIFNYDNLAYSSVYGKQAANPAEPLYHSDPFGVELNGVAGYQSAVGIFVDDYSQVLLDLGCSNPSVTRIGSRFADMEVHITCANNLQDACLAHSSCVGRTKLFPRWVLGYHQGCYGYDTREKVLAAINTYRKYNIPIDGVHIDVDLQRHYRTFTIDDGPGGPFANAKDMFSQLAQLGVKASTNITPVISTKDDNGKDYWNEGSQARAQYKTLDSGMTQNVFVKDQRWNEKQNPPVYTYWEGGNQITKLGDYVPNMNTPQGQTPEYRGGVSYGENLGTNGVYPDLGRKEVREWWGKQYKYLFESGLSMVWQDMTTPCIRTGVGDMKSFPFRLLLSDDTESSRARQGVLSPAIKVNNLFSYNLHKATHAGVRQLAPRKGLRNFIIGRGSFTGQHRYGGLWTGDNTSSFDFLRINIQQVLSCGIGGTVISGADVGGFEAFPFNSQWCDPQLLARWTIANALLPWFRNHYNGKPGHKLWQEPYGYFENANKVPEQALLYKAVLPICRYYITLRYTLLQLLYDNFFGSLWSGKPVARSMLATDPWDLSLLDQNSPYLALQYMVGQDVLVAPVLHSEEERAASQFLRTVYLPSGSKFYDFNLHLQQTNDDPANAQLQPNWSALSSVRTGGTVFEYISSIDRFAQGDTEHLAYLLPIFIREGAIVPTQNQEMFVRQVKQNPIVLHIYPTSTIGAKTEHDLYLDDGVSLASAPADLPQFKLDKQSGAKSDYRHVHIEHFRASEAERSLTLNLKHSKYDLQRTRSDIGSILTLQLWHDANEAQKASTAKVAVKGEGGNDENVENIYDARLNATIIRIPVDDVQQREIKFTFAPCA